MEQLSHCRCQPCSGTSQPVANENLMELLEQVPEWQLVESDQGVRQLERTFTFKNFLQALEFSANVGHLAESEGHHPTLVTEWGKVTVRWWTHAISDLHENDFVMAAKTNSLYLPRLQARAVNQS